MEDKQLKILAIEDNLGDFIILQEYLSEVLPKSTLERKTYLAEAKTALSSYKYDVILLDLSLPDSDGTESVNEILQLTNGTPVIVFTGYEDKQFGKDTLKLGVQDYLIKDEVNPAILLKSITYAIERKAVLNQIKSSRENYKSIFDKNPIPLFLFDPSDYKILMVNQASVDMYQYSLETFQNLTALHLMPPAEQARFVAMLSNPGLKSGAVFLGEWRHARADLSEVEVEFTTHDFLLGLTPCRLAVINNVTERNKARRELQMSENRFRSLVQSGSDMIGILDEEGRYTYKSPTITKVLGYTQEFLLGKSAFELIHEDDLEQVKADFAKVFFNTSVAFKPFRVKDSNGNWRWIESIVTNLLNDPAVKGIVTNSRDITEKKKQEDEKTLLINELTQNNKDLRQFSFITSHNLRAPITNLLSILELIGHANIKEEAALFFIDMFRKSTLQLDDTINDLVKILVIKNNTSVSMEQVNFEDIFSKTTEQMSVLISSINTKINYDFSQAPVIYSNPAYLESIFMNLLTNALKYRDPDRPLELNVTSTTDKLSNTILLHFRDNGLGIDLNRNKNKIFGLHQRFHEQGEGKGIGLYLIQSQIKALGGTITVDSTVNVGTTFTITFNI